MIEAQTQAAPLPATTAPRPVIRCPRCSLNQFLTTSGLCRRCEAPLVIFESPMAALAVPALQVQHVLSHKIMVSTARENQPQVMKVTRRQFRWIATRLRSFRNFAGLTQEDLAVSLPMPRSYLSRLENAYMVPSPDLLEKIVGELGLTMNQFVAGEDLGPRIFGEFLKLTDEQKQKVLVRVHEMRHGVLALFPI